MYWIKSMLCDISSSIWIEYTEEIVGEKKKKTFYVNEPDPEGNSLVILSFAKEKVVVNVGLLEVNDHVI